MTGVYGRIGEHWFVLIDEWCDGTATLLNL